MNLFVILVLTGVSIACLFGFIYGLTERLSSLILCCGLGCALFSTITFNMVENRRLSMERRERLELENAEKSCSSGDTLNCQNAIEGVEMDKVRRKYLLLLYKTKTGKPLPYKG